VEKKKEEEGKEGRDMLEVHDCSSWGERYVESQLPRGSSRVPCDSYMSISSAG